MGSYATQHTREAAILAYMLCCKHNHATAVGNARTRHKLLLAGFQVSSSAVESISIAPTAAIAMPSFVLGRVLLPLLALLGACIPSTTAAGQSSVAPHHRVSLEVFYRAFWCAPLVTATVCAALVGTLTCSRCQSRVPVVRQRPALGAHAQRAVSRILRCEVVGGCLLSL